MDNWRADRIGAALRGENPTVLARVPAGLHAHVWPRYEWEPADRRGHPVWLYPSDRWTDPATALSAAHDPLRAAIAAQLLKTVGEPPATTPRRARPTGGNRRS